MLKITMWFKKTLLVALIAALGGVSVPLVDAYAQSPQPPVASTPSSISTTRLSQIWAREQSIYNRIGNLLNRADTLISKIQDKLDQAKANGKDVSSVQSALDEFAAAVKAVHPIYESAKGIIASHQGFDNSGQVTDPVQALATVKDLHQKLLDIRNTGVREAGKALRDAIQAFCQQNAPTSTPTPGQNGG